MQASKIFSGTIRFARRIGDSAAESGGLRRWLTRPTIWPADFARRANLPQSAALISPPNQQYIPCRPVSQEGRFAVVTDVRRDAVDADGALTKALEVDGEVVWS
jgi:hypothetical protein